MKRSNTFGALLIASITYIPVNSTAQFGPNEVGEGFDRQSPEEIEKARLEIEALFKDAVEPMLYGYVSEILRIVKAPLKTTSVIMVPIIKSGQELAKR